MARLMSSSKDLRTARRKATALGQCSGMTPEAS
jgi:hypothetical protein